MSLSRLLLSGAMVVCGSALLWLFWEAAFVRKETTALIGLSCGAVLNSSGLAALMWPVIPKPRPRKNRFADLAKKLEDIR